MIQKSRVYQIDLFPEQSANVKRTNGLRSYFNVTPASQERIRAIANQYTHWYDSIHTLRIICEGD